MDNALYFPFISVPESSWFTRILLYWDNVGSIIPFEFVDTPERLSSYTRDLLTDGLITQIHPAQYIWQAPRFTEAFVDFIESISNTELGKRRNAFREHKTFRVHTEKMDEIADYLISTRLASKYNWSWCDVESTTASEFMTYLAALLGKLEDVKSTPVTDTIANLEMFADTSKLNKNIESRLASLRSIVLEQLLPVPLHSVPPHNLLKIKQKHGAQLRHFRHSIEQEISSIADMTDSDLQQYRLTNFISSKKDEIEEITAHLSEGNLGEIVFSRICAIVSAIPGANALFGLANAIYSAFSGSSQKIESGALLYAAYIKKKLK